jgi:hypothetical protein
VVTVSLPGLPSHLLQPGVGHSIVILQAQKKGTFEIADPFAGRQVWTRQQLVDAYSGDVFALIPVGNAHPE